MNQRPAITIKRSIERGWKTCRVVSANDNLDLHEITLEGPSQKALWMALDGSIKKFPEDAPYKVIVSSAKAWRRGYGFRLYALLTIKPR